MRLFSLVSTCIMTFCFSSYVHTVDWSRYTAAQLLQTREKLVKSGRASEVTQQIQKELSNRGIMATITLAEAPPGQEWVLRDKNITIEKTEGGPTTPPPGAGPGQWVLANQQWLYLEKDSGKILNNSGTVIGKIGFIEPTSPESALTIKVPIKEEGRVKARIEELEAQIKKLEEANRLHKELKDTATAEKPTKGISKIEEDRVKARMEELEAQIKKLEEEKLLYKELKDASIPEKSAESLPTPEEVAPSTDTAAEVPSGAPEAPAFGGPEIPEAPAFEAPEAPPLEGPPGAPDLTPTKPTKATADLKPLSTEEMHSLSSVQKNRSDELFAAAIQKIITTFSSNIGNEPYFEIIKKELKALSSQADFYKREELDKLQQDKTLKDCLAGDIDTIITCFTVAFKGCLFQETLANSLESAIRDIALTLTNTSDQLFKNSVQKCITTFPNPGQITSQSYAKMIETNFSDLDKNKNFHKKNNYKLPLRTLIQELQNIAYDPEHPEAYLIFFNKNKADYAQSWIQACNQCLFNQKNYEALEDDLQWLISFIIAAGRGQKDLEKVSSVAQNLSDYMITNLFIDSTDETTIENTWLPKLQNFLTEPFFAKPYGLMISYVSTGQFSAKTLYNPVLQILTEPLKKIGADQYFINSVAASLAFDMDAVKKRLNAAKGSISLVLSKQKSMQATAPAAEQPTPKPSNYFAPNSFSQKTFLQVIELLNKIRRKDDSLKEVLFTLNTNIPALLATTEKTMREQMSSEQQEKLRPEEIEKALTEALLSLQDSLVKKLTAADFTPEQITNIKNVFNNHIQHFLLLYELTKHMKTYENNIKQNPAYKNGKNLYQFVKKTIKDEALIQAFASMTREPDSLYAALGKYLKAVIPSLAKVVPTTDFRKTIEPYGILVSLLVNFNEEMSSPITSQKALERLINAITALNTAKLSTGTDYPDIIINAKDSIENQMLYKGKLDSLLQALIGKDFAAFVNHVDTFVAAADTLAHISPDGTIIREPAYAQLIDTLKTFEQKLLLTNIRQTVEALNKGNYETLPGFDDKNVETLKILLALRGKFTPLVKILAQSKFDPAVYKKTYTELISGPEFMQGIPATQQSTLKERLLELFDATAKRIEESQKTQKE